MLGEEVDGDGVGSHDDDTIIGGELLNDNAWGGGVKNLWKSVYVICGHSHL